ncbi:MAG: DUF2933 domain-containing protein [Burkholderiaceae bacterium]|nr:DUF2933 domain-containing protein [Gammaproteobacteria bacterium]MCP5284392.1 DUF2933 domain-containing protein [Burkholderiaceae bacterium]
MDWLTENWIWVIFGVAFIAMHLFGHGGHGRHGGGGCGHGSDEGHRDPTRSTADGPPATPANRAREPHRHQE